MSRIGTRTGKILMMKTLQKRLPELKYLTRKMPTGHNTLVCKVLLFVLLHVTCLSISSPGSADSEIPSPLPMSKQDSYGHLSELSHPVADKGEIVTITVPYTTLHPPSKVPGDPPHPQDLSVRLVALNAPKRTDIQPPTLDTPSDTVVNEQDEKTIQIKSNSPGAITEPGVLLPRTASNGPVYWNGFGAPLHSSHAAGNDAVSTTPPQPSAVLLGDLDAALKDSIRGIYRLWLAGKPSQAKPSSAEGFLNEVRNIVTQIDPSGSQEP